MRIEDDWYISLQGASIWEVYDNLSGIFRGGGNASYPKLVTGNGLRSRDFQLKEDVDGVTYVMPNIKGGLSFSATIERLANQRPRPVRGTVWRVPKGTFIPVGLCVNYDRRDIGHPMIGAAYEMPIDAFVSKLKSLADLMVKTNHRF